MPRELIAAAPRTLEWREYEEPELRPGQVRLKSEFSAAKHGTEMAFYKGYAHGRGSWNEALQLFEGRSGSKETVGYPFHVGNMVVGTVTDVGEGVTGLAVGDRAYAWRSFRETHTLRATDCVKMDNGLTWRSAVCNDPAHFALGGVRDGKVRVGDRVAVFGLGAIGLMAVQIARVSGAIQVIAVDPVAGRREVARRLGANLTIDPVAEDAGKRVKEATGGRGADACLEYSGSRDGLQHAVRGVAYGGNVVCGAFPPPYGAGLDLGAEAHLNVPNLVFSRACSVPDRDHPRWDWDRVRETCRLLLERGTIRGDDIVSPVVKFDDLKDEYARVATDPQAGIKLGVEH